jgi:NadR type nicotinamide-nucleotide adenylyltransferase
LGKFAPLHAGHQYMIETAMQEMDEVKVMIYDSPEVTDIPLPIRADWLKRLYPSVEVIEAWDGPSEIGNTPQIKKMHETYILDQLKGQKITHFYSSEFYGEHVSAALGAVDRRIDEERVHYPISGTKVRDNSYPYRKFLDPIVYDSLITKVVFLGAPSTGKTTIAEHLAKEYQTTWMLEYGREYWERNQIERRLTKEQLVELAEGHLTREDALILEADKYFFVDTNAITTYVFSQDYHHDVHPDLVQLADQAARRYDLVFLCEDDIPYEDTWDRSGDVHRRIFQKKIIADLSMRKIPFIRLQGSLEERTAMVKGILDKYEKYKGLGELVVTNR